MTTPQTATAPFDQGVGSFDPMADRVLLWTRLHGGGLCRWELADDEAFARVVGSGDVEVGPEGFVIVDATDLRPGTTYWYRFSDGTTTSPVGRTRTLPQGHVGHLRVGVTCCARYGQAEFTVYRELADADVDLVVHLGDYIYEDDKCDIDERRPDPDGVCRTLDEYRRRHAQARRDPDLQALHARHPMVVVWDDHDFADNAWRAGAQNHDDEEDGPWPPRFQAALQAHQEFLPKRLADPCDLTSAWRRLDLGDLLSIVCTETRAHRDQPAGSDGAPPADHPERTMLGAEQAGWLLDTVTDPEPTWLLVASGTLVSELVLDAPDALDQVVPEKYAVIDGQAVNTDQWDGYVVERRALADALGRRGGGNVILSGDIHSSWAIEGPRSSQGEPVAVEFVCPPAATTPIGQLFPSGVGELLAPKLREQLPRVRWVELDHHGYVLLDVRPDALEASWWWVEPGGTDGARRGRRWSVPRSGPTRLVDPEPQRGDGDGEVEAPSPLSVVRRRQRLRVAAASLVALGLAGVALALRRSGAAPAARRWSR